MDSDRSDIVTWVQAALDRITPGQLLLLEYVTGDDLPVEPHARQRWTQAAGAASSCQPVTCRGTVGRSTT